MRRTQCVSIFIPNVFAKVRATSLFNTLSWCNFRTRLNIQIKTMPSIRSHNEKVPAHVAYWSDTSVRCPSRVHSSTKGTRQNQERELEPGKSLLFSKCRLFKRSRVGGKDNLSHKTGKTLNAKSYGLSRTDRKYNKKRCERKMAVSALYGHSC